MTGFRKNPNRAGQKSLPQKIFFATADERPGSPQLFQLKPKLVGEIALGLTGLFGPGPGGPFPPNALP